VINVVTEIGVPTGSLVRPLALAIMLVVLVQAAASVLAGSRHVGALIAAFAWTVLVVPRAGLLLVAVVLAAMLVETRRDHRLRFPRWPALSSGLNVVTAVLLALTVVSAVSSGLGTDPSIPSVSSAATAAPDAPDIYLVMLDGYPRADTLADTFGYDNRPFLDRMTDLGFDVAENSHSNYTLTSLSLSSLFSHDAVDDLLPHPPNGAAAQFKRLGQLVSEGRGFSEAREHGYELVAITSAVTPLTPLGVDRTIDDGGLTTTEVELLRQGFVKRMFPDVQRHWFAEDARQRINSTFGSLKELASEGSPRPRLIFAHVLAPHPPVVFDAEGGPVDGWPCVPDCSPFDPGQWLPRDVVKPAVKEQVTHINDLVEDTIASVIATNRRPAVVVVFSDHGSRIDVADREEMLRNLILTRTPGQPDLFPDDATPINILPRLFNAYLGTDIAFAPERSYYSPFWQNVTLGIFPLEPAKLSTMSVGGT
jgi:hypothetical protein